MKTRFTRALATMAGAALLTATTAAAAAPAPAPARNPAASLSLAKTRTGSVTTAESKLGAEVPTTTLISIGILGALTAVVLLVVADEDDSDSN